MRDPVSSTVVERPGEFMTCGLGLAAMRMPTQARNGLDRQVDHLGHRLGQGDPAS